MKDRVNFVLFCLSVAVAAVCYPRVACAQTASAPAGTSWAVVVGLDYNWNPDNRLQFTLSDAQRFQRYLNAPAGHTAFLTDDESAVSDSGEGATHVAGRATRDNILQAIRRIASKARPEDTFWFYFSGHGQFLPASESSFLIPADVQSLTEKSGISVRDLRTMLADPAVCRAHSKILVLDACESGSSRRWNEIDGTKADAGGASGAQAARVFAPLAGVMTFAASRPDRSAWETEQNPVAGGVFTYYLCCGLAGAAGASAQSPNVTLGALQGYVISHVNELCDKLGHPRQEPVFLASAGAPAGGKGMSFTNVAPGAPSEPNGSGLPPAVAKIVVGRYDEAALDTLMAKQFVAPTALHERPRLEPGVILVVESDNSDLRTYTQNALQNVLLQRGIALYSGEIAPQFLAVLRDPKRTPEGLEEARRLSARLLLRIRLETSASPSTVIAGAAIARVTLHAEVTDVYGETKAANEASGGPTPTGDSPLLIQQALETEIHTALDALTASDSALIKSLPKRRAEP